jgi:hypothetical protein
VGKVGQKAQKQGIFGSYWAFLTNGQLKKGSGEQGIGK